MSTHARNTTAMRSSPRCGARTRAGAACEAPAVKDKERCRMHGCGRGAGGQLGNRNAMKHGAFAASAQLSKMIAQMNELEKNLLRHS